MMTAAAKWLRRLEIAFMLAGISFIGGAFAATVARWDYQAKQEASLDRSMFRSAATFAVTGEEATHPPEEQKVLDRWDASLAMGRIEIPRVGVRAIVREGIDDATLALAVGHLDGTARPGQTGNIVLAGHRDTFFRGLRNIRLDDRVRLDVPPHRYEYRVVSLEVVAPTETRVLDPTGGEELTLVTCHPFGFIGDAPNRFIVRAARVE